MSAAIGIIGLGQMGAPMAANLLAAGHEVIGLDVNASQGASLAGKPGYTRGAGLADVGRCGTVILMLPNSKIVDDVLWNQGLAKLLAKGSLVLDMSSSEPLKSRENAGKLAAIGLDFVDAPVSGGVKRAIEGTLAIMIGGEAAAVERARPVLEALGKTLVHVGAAGSGHAVKALNNYVSASGLLAVSEAMAAAQRFGIDPHVVNKVFNASSGKNSATEQKMEQFILSGTFGSGFALSLMRKDLDTALAFMNTMETPTDFAKVCTEIWHDADSALPAADHTKMYSYINK